MRASWLLSVAAIATIATVFAVPLLDEPLARWLAHYDVDPRPWEYVLDVGEYLIGVEPWKWIGIIALLIGVIATRVVPRWQSHALTWLFIATTHLACWNVMMWGKHLTGRLRPLQWRGGATFWHHGGSFPSGHVMLFASILLPLAVIFPRARTVCCIGVAFVMVARIALSAHFLGDVTCGLALTSLVTWGAWAWTQRLELRATWPTRLASPR